MSRKPVIAPSNMTSNPPPSGVDFLFRTMLERESTGKRKIRPKNVEDLFVAAMGDESDDPDYEEAESRDSNSDRSDDDTTDNSNDSSSDDEDTNDGSSEDSSEDGSSSDESDNDDGVSLPKGKKSALRETLQKLNDASFEARQPKRKKKKRVSAAGTSTKGKKASNSKSSIGKGKNASSSGNTNSASRKRPANSSLENTKSKSAKLEKSKNSSDNRSKSKSLAKDKLKPNSKKAKRKSRKRSKGHKSKYSSISDLINTVSSNQKENRKEIDENRTPICSACLGDKSDESNEIVECDFCGITVHEGCYGIGDSLSISSGSGSSCSTEPWFCEACKHGADKITCELCPTAGGLFKETSSGRWVHLVCALYTPGVEFGDSDSPPNLNNLRYKWGSHTCSLCECERYATTGISIQCDAGLCKTYLHVTCAQMAGLLSDYTQADSMGPEADPYFAACKLHTNREISKRRAEAYKTLQEQLRIKKEKKESDMLTAMEKQSQTRIMEKLNKIRTKNSLKQSKGPLNCMEKYSVQNNLISNGKSIEKSRLLQTSASARDIFTSKAEMMGENVRALEMEERNERIVTNVKRKWNVQPALTVEFAAYYHDREVRITTMTKQCEVLERSNMLLNDKQIALKNACDTNCLNNQAIAEDSEEIKVRIEEFKSILLQSGSPNKKFINACSLLSKCNDQSLNARRSPSRLITGSSGTLAKNNKTMKLLSPTHTGRLSMLKCDVCNKAEGQHMITNCDECKKNYHLGCLDPPLSRMPKRTRLQGWVCSDCNEAESQAEDDTKEPQVDTDAPRILRGRTNIKKPGKYRNSDESGDEDLKIISEKIVTVDKKPILKSVLEQVSPEVHIVKELNPAFVNGGVRSSRRRSGTGNINVPNITVPIKSPTPVTPAKNICMTSPSVASSNSNYVPPVVVKREVVSPTPMIKTPKSQKRKKSKNAITEMENSTEFTVLSEKQNEKSLAKAKKDKAPIVITIRKDSVDKTRPTFTVEDNVTAIIRENASVPSTPLGSNQLNSKTRKPSGKKQKAPVSPGTVQMPTPDQKCVPLKKRRRVPSTPTPVVPNSNGSSVGKTKFTNMNKNSRLESPIDLKTPVQIKIEHSISSQSSSLNSSPYSSHSNLLTVNTSYGTQPVPSTINHLPLVGMVKNPLINRDRMEKDNVSVFMASAAQTWSADAQNHIQLHYNVDLHDNSRNFSPGIPSATSSPAGLEGKCDTCGKTDLRKQLVMCDKCKLDFHFTCLHPPLKYSPKRRGYSWFCANCDETSSTDSKNENGFD